ncbi:hypothetical protein [Frankia gtarii]|uniref:hypothetical protein n=1 Tax=Frankia gtarii TaxID=2950102 RepID=UPI0021BF3249|nr:hypothetical protein [Frankia gtarii]
MASQARDVWVDFNELDPAGRITVYADAVETHDELAIGAQILVGDEDGNTATATVLTRHPDPPHPDLYTLQVDRASFAPHPPVSGTSPPDPPN